LQSPRARKSGPVHAWHVARRNAGFDVELVAAVSEAVSIPVIASSGAGKPEHFSEVFARTCASAALAAGIFHRREVPIAAVKAHMAAAGIPTRI